MSAFDSTRATKWQRCLACDIAVRCLRSAVPPALALSSRFRRRLFTRPRGTAPLIPNAFLPTPSPSLMLSATSCRLMYFVELTQFGSIASTTLSGYGWGGGNGRGLPWRSTPRQLPGAPPLKGPLMSAFSGVSHCAVRAWGAPTPVSFHL